MGEKTYWNIIKSAKTYIMEWAKEHNMPIYRVEYVATFEKWDTGIEIYIFFENEETRRLIESVGFDSKIKDSYKSILKELKYPFEKYPNLHFYFDSDENVKNNYSGNYFYRLR